MIEIPENFTEFLYWVKERTESFWSIDPKSSTNDFVCEEWIYGAKWIGLTENEIDEIENKYSIRFIPEHREFLKILHTIDRKRRIEYTETFEDDAEILIKEVPFFYNWLKDEVIIKERIEWPFDTIYEDIIGSNQVWLKSWGVKPQSDEKKKEIFANWYNKTPKLLPVTGHRFIISENDLKYRPVLSIYGSDIIVYGWSFKTYILRELQDHLGLNELIFDKEDKEWYPQLKREVQEIYDNDFKYGETKNISYWEEMILIWTSGWSSFGLKYPRENDAVIRPIMKTYVPEDEENKQKTFTNF